MACSGANPFKETTALQHPIALQGAPLRLSLQDTLPCRRATRQSEKSNIHLRGASPCNEKKKKSKQVGTLQYPRCFLQFRQEVCDAEANVRSACPAGCLQSLAHKVPDQVGLRWKGWCGHPEIGGKEAEHNLAAQEAAKGTVQRICHKVCWEGRMLLLPYGSSRTLGSNGKACDFSFFSRGKVCHT